MTRAALVSLLLALGCAHGSDDDRSREKWCRSVVESPSSRPDERARCRLLLNDLGAREAKRRPAGEVITGWQLARTSAGARTR
jgi:hypothetical protein